MLSSVGGALAQKQRARHHPPGAPEETHIHAQALPKKLWGYTDLVTFSSIEKKNPLVCHVTYWKDPWKGICPHLSPSLAVLPKR